MSGGNRNAPRMVMKPDFDFDMEWVDQAACAGAPTEIFFPNYHTQESTAQARVICKKCGVVWECLKYATEVPIDFGVWGGMLPSERRRYFRENKLPPTQSRG